MREEIPSQELLRRLAEEGDAEAWAAMVVRHAALLRSVAVAIVGPTAADDVVQEAFLHVRDGARNFKPLINDEEVAVRAWLVRIATNCALNFRQVEVRRHAREAVVAQEHQSGESESREVDPEIHRLLFDTLAEMPESQRRPIMLRFFAGIDGQAFAQALSCKATAARKRLSRSLDQLRNRLQRAGTVVALAALADRLSAAGNIVISAPSNAAIAGYLTPRAGRKFATHTVLGGHSLAAKLVLISAAALVISIGGIGTFIATSETTTAWASPLDAIKPGEWYQAPNTRLDKTAGVCPPNPCPPGNPMDIIRMWGGGAYDTKRDRLILHGGGAGYAGNEIYAFDVKTMTWSRPWGPSALSAIPARENNSQVYADGNPPSANTYDGLIYLPAQDQLWRGGGALWTGYTNACWTFDFTRLKWERKADLDTLRLGTFADVDPITGHIFAAGSSGMLQEFDPSANLWMTRGGIERGEEMTSAIDPEHRLFVAIGNGHCSIYNIATKTIANDHPTTGGEAIVNSRGPGLVYDSAIKKIVGWNGGSTSVYSLDVATWTWTEHRAATTNTATPPKPWRDVFGRFRYIPSKNIYILVNAVNEDVWFYKLAADSGSRK